MDPIKFIFKLASLFILISLITGNKQRKIHKEKHSPKSSLRWRIGTASDDKKIADEMMSLMNQTVDPCDDFFEFACGRFVEDHTPPPDGVSYSSIGETSDRNTNELKSSFIERFNGLLPAENRAIEDAITYYKSCLDTDSREAEGSKPLLQLLHKLGTWSILQDNFDANTWNSDLATLEMAKMGFHPQYETYVSENPLQTDEVLIMFDQPTFYYFGELRSIIDVDYDMELLIQSLQGMALFLGADVEKLSKIEELYTALAPLLKAALAPRKYSTMYDNMTKMTIEDFSQQTGIELQSLLGHVNGLLAPSGQKVDKDEIVAVLEIETITAAQDLFKSMDKEMRSLYLLSPLVWFSLDYLPGEFKWFKYFLYNVHLGLPKEDLDTSSDTFCYAETRWAYSRVFWRLFADKMSTPEAVADATNLVEDIREAMIEKLNNVSWMDKKTRDKAIEKANQMVTNIAYPDDLVTDDSLEEYYKDMNPDPKQFLQNMYKILRERARKMYSMYGKPFNRELWDMDVFMTNAGNYLTKNKIAVPTAFIQRRMYNPLVPRSFNYGAIGMVVGHEIGHSYDWTGRKFDIDGSKRNWWSNASTIEYERRAKCFKDQYNNQTYEGKHENGNISLSENIADSEGLEIAYRAYQDYVKAHGKERSLPGIQLSNEKLFFLGFGQTFCGVFSKEFAHILIDEDVHALAPIRIRETLKNSPEFATAYQCPIGSKMNPAVKCNIF